jgi:hypothetical protein
MPVMANTLLNDKHRECDEHVTSERNTRQLGN